MFNGNTPSSVVQLQREILGLSEQYTRLNLDVLDPDAPEWSPTVLERLAKARAVDDAAGEILDEMQDNDNPGQDLLDSGRRVIERQRETVNALEESIHETMQHIVWASRQREPAMVGASGSSSSGGIPTTTPADEIPGLSPEHRTYLAERGITDPHVIVSRGYRTRAEGLEMPIYSLPDARRHGYETRLDEPRPNAEGKLRKFDKPQGQRNVLNVPPDAVERILDPSLKRLWIVEGTTRADALLERGVPAVSINGCWNWMSGKAIIGCFREIPAIGQGCEVCLAFDGDVATNSDVRHAASELVKRLRARGADPLVLLLPDGQGLDDYLAAGNTVASLDRLLTRRLPALRDTEEPATVPEATPAPVATPVPVDDAVAVFQEHLDIERAPILLTAATILANELQGDPVWTVLVAPPSSAKTEVLMSLADLPKMHIVSTLTEASLLSGTSQKEKAKNATGGVLREVGDFGFLVAKDLTSVLSAHGDSRKQTLAALREIYDGVWERLLGTDGGLRLSWAGKLGFIGGCTPTIDRHAAEVSALGDRWIFYRLERQIGDDAGLASMAHTDTATMRQALRRAMGGLVEHGRRNLTWIELPMSDRRRLVKLVTYTATARGAVERDGFTRDVLSQPIIEGTPRLAQQFQRLLIALRCLGVPEDETWGLLARIARDSVPMHRDALLRVLLERPEDAKPLSTPDAAGLADIPGSSAKRYLEDLMMLKVVKRELGDRIGNFSDRSWLWSASEWLREYYPQ